MSALVSNLTTEETWEITTTCITSFSSAIINKPCILFLWLIYVLPPCQWIKKWWINYTLITSKNPETHLLKNKKSTTIHERCKFFNFECWSEQQIYRISNIYYTFFEGYIREIIHSLETEFYNEICIKINNNSIFGLFGLFKF